MECSLTRLSLLAAVFCAATPVLVAQNNATSGQIHGHLTNAIGAPESTGTIRLTTQREESDLTKVKFQYTFKVDDKGNYKGAGIEPDDYLMVYIKEGAVVDFIDHVIIKSGVDLEFNDDMTRAEFWEHLSPEVRKQYEEVKAKNAAALSTNAKVANINGLLKKAREEMAAKNYDAAFTDMTQATQAKPDEAILWNELGNAQLGLNKFDDSIVSYKKALELDAASKKSQPDLVAATYNQLGMAYVRTSKMDDAVAAYEKAAAAEPSKAGSYYFNEAATLYNTHRAEAAAAAAADKAIAADPNKADAYYIKGMSMIGGSKEDPTSHKMIPPAGCMDALQKYLDLDPNGKHAGEIKAIVAEFDQKMVTDFRAGRPKKK